MLRVASVSVVKIPKRVISAGLDGEALSGDNGVKMLSSARDWGSIHWSDTEPIGLKC